VKKAIMIGDYSRPMYHPLAEVDKELTDILKGKVDIEFTEEYTVINYENLKKFDLCILYVDRWDDPVDEMAIKDLIKFIEEGGRVMVIHNGISFQSNEDFKELIGAEFTGHPPYTKLEIIAKNEKHPIMNGIKAFYLEDEPYRYEFCIDPQIDIFLEYIHEGNAYPAGWTKYLIKGKLVYLMPGHNVASFKNPSYRELVFNSALWVLE
jgi:type 1 glutamine amidotransferase